MNYLINIDVDYFRLIYKDFDRLPDHEKFRLMITEYKEIEANLKKGKTIFDYTGCIRITPLSKHRLRIVRSTPIAYKY